MCLFPLVQCTYIGPTVNTNNFLLSYKPIGFLRLPSFRLTSMFSISPVMLISRNSHLFNFRIVWKDEPVVIVPHSSITDSHPLLLTRKCSGTSIPSSIWPLPWRRREGLESNNKTYDVWESYSAFAARLFVLIHYARDIVGSVMWRLWNTVQWTDRTSWHLLALSIEMYSVVSDGPFLSLILLSYPRCLQTCSMYVFCGGVWGSWG